MKQSLYLRQRRQILASNDPKIITEEDLSKQTDEAIHEPVRGSSLPSLGPFKQTSGSESSLRRVLLRPRSPVNVPDNLIARSEDISGARRVRGGRQIHDQSDPSLSCFEISPPVHDSEVKPRCA